MNRKLLLAAWIMMAPLLLVTEVVGQASRNPRNNPERTRYVVIPINGMLGGSTVAAGVESITMPVSISICTCGR